MRRTRGYIGWILAAGVLAGILGALSDNRALGGPDVLGGTVTSVRPEALYIVDSPDGGKDGPGREVMVQVDGETEYYHGTKRTTSDAVVPGLRVVVRYERAGTVLRAKMIRIVGGKAR